MAGPYNLMKKPFSKQPAQELHDLDKELEEDVLGWKGEGPDNVASFLPAGIVNWIYMVVFYSFVISCKKVSWLLKLT